MNQENLDDLIRRLHLEPLEGEGGYFIVDKEINISKEFSQIYYLISAESFSHLHKLSSTEIWTCVDGDLSEQLLINEKGDYNIKNLSNNRIDASISSIVEKNIWQGTKLVKGGTWALFSITVIPPYKEESYTEATDILIEKFSNCPILKEFLN
ncbi:MAG: cupin domain-containing protein [Spirochaetaceae bacterium]|nr:cupin domain-containing protein [Spirochaetaceae bacterium]